MNFLAHRRIFCRFFEHTDKHQVFASFRTEKFLYPVLSLCKRYIAAYFCLVFCKIFRDFLLFFSRGKLLSNESRNFQMGQIVPLQIFYHLHVASFTIVILPDNYRHFLQSCKLCGSVTSSPSENLVAAFFGVWPDSNRHKYAIPPDRLRKLLQTFFAKDGSGLVLILMQIRKLHFDRVSGCRRDRRILARISCLSSEKTIHCQIVQTVQC